MMPRVDMAGAMLYIGADPDMADIAGELAIIIWSLGTVSAVDPYDPPGPDPTDAELTDPDGHMSAPWLFTQ
jgi:hypothetical protein